MSGPLTVVDLFAGVGGLSLGFVDANSDRNGIDFDVKLLADADQSAAYTFKKNFPHIPYWCTDLASVEGADILELLGLKKGALDFLVGGPPCQGFSSNGKRLLGDPRNELMCHFVTMALGIAPKCIIIENVPLALSSLPKIVDEEVKEMFPGYVVASRTLNASAFGVPQIRRRAFIVALREDMGAGQVDFPTGEFEAVDVGKDLHSRPKDGLRYVSVHEAIGDLPPLKSGEEMDGVPYPCAPQSDYQIERRSGSIGIFNHASRAHSKSFLKKISRIKPGQRNADLPDGKRFSDNYYSQAYARLHPEGIGFTITAHFHNPGSGRFTHYRDNRAITVREAARLQSFDDRFILHGVLVDQIKHVGNAVPPLLSKALATHFGSIMSKL